MSERPQTSKSIPRAIAFVIVLASLLIAGSFVLLKGPSLLSRGMSDGAAEAANETHKLARKIASDIDSVIQFRPKIVCEGTTVVEASSKIVELSTVEKPFEYTHSYESTWFGSTKRITLKGRFLAKAGYDLSEPITLNIEELSQNVRIKGPSAKVHSVEQLEVKILQDQDGLWNKVSTEEREMAMNALLVNAKASIDHSKILREAEDSFREQLENIIRKSLPNHSDIIYDPLL